MPDTRTGSHNHNSLKRSCLKYVNLQIFNFTVLTGGAESRLRLQSPNYRLLPNPSEKMKTFFFTGVVAALITAVSAQGYLCEAAGNSCVVGDDIDCDRLCKSCNGAGVGQCIGTFGTTCNCFVP